jgi:hypothetical protein
VKLADGFKLLEPLAEGGIRIRGKDAGFGADGGKAFFNLRTLREITRQRILGGEPDGQRCGDDDADCEILEEAVHGVFLRWRWRMRRVCVWAEVL